MPTSRRTSTASRATLIAALACVAGAGNGAFAADSPIRSCRSHWSEEFQKSVLEEVPQRARGWLLWTANHNQVLLHAPTTSNPASRVVISRTEQALYVTAIRPRLSGTGASRVRHAPLSQSLALAMMAVLEPLADLSRTAPEATETGWTVELVPGKCVFVTQGLLDREPAHWSVAVIQGLDALTEARTRAQREAAEAGIYAAIDVPIRQVRVP